MNQFLKPNPDRLRDTIDHVVVLMLENRSFDNLLGWLYADERPPDGQHFEGLTPELWNPLENIDSDGISFIEKVPVERNGQPKRFHGTPASNPVSFTLPDPDPGEGYRDTNHQLFGRYEVAAEFPPPPMNTGFVENYKNAMLFGTFSFGDAPTDPRAIMKCYTPAQTPVLSGLATGFAVCDQYHCSVPSQTIPNRDFVHAATSTGNVNNRPVLGCDARTIFNQIQDAIDCGRTELSWGVFGNNLMVAGKDEAGRVGANHFSLTRLVMSQLHDPRFTSNFGTLDDFNDRCAAGELPSYAFLEPSYGGPTQNDQHPPSDIRPGEQLINDIYSVVRSSPKFDKTLLIVTYDEHGGCYDHVPPPGRAKPPSANAGSGQDGFLFNRFGVRVPCVVINPYIPKGLIARPAGFTPFDHTSIIKTVQTCFGLEGHLTDRDAAAPDFSCLLTLDTPRTADLPSPTPVQRDPSAAAPSVNALHRVMAEIAEQLTGNAAADSADLLEFIQSSYDALFVAPPTHA